MLVFLPHPISAACLPVTEQLIEAAEWASARDDFAEVVSELLYQLASFAATPGVAAPQCVQIGSGRHSHTTIPRRGPEGKGLNDQLQIGISVATTATCG